MVELVSLVLALASASPAVAEPDSPGEREAPGESGRREYDEKHIWAEDYPVVYGDGHHFGTTIGTFFYQGKYRKLLADRTFTTPAGARTSPSRSGRRCRTSISSTGQT